ncbi:cupin domain-containing protein [Bdellovibrionota bacterium FG-1]
MKVTRTNLTFGFLLIIATAASTRHATAANKTLTIQLPPQPSEYFQILSPPTSVTMRSGLVTLEPGKRVGRHPTGQFEEMVIPLEGAGEMDVTGKGKTHFKQGQVLYAPPGTEHDVENIGKTTLRYIYVVAKTPTTPDKK